MKRGVWKRLAARTLPFCIAILFAVSGSVSPDIYNSLAASSQVQPRRPGYAPGQLIVKLRETISNELLERHSLKFRENLSPNFLQDTSLLVASVQEHLYLLETDPSADMEALATSLQAEENVEYAEPNYAYELQVQPNDPLYNSLAYSDSQWAPRRTGMELVWAEKTRTNTVIVNLDTGIDITHPDLVPNLWKNDREASGIVGIDDDGNGYIDDVYGWNFVFNTPDVQDHSGHGTLTAGVNARGNNGIGVAGYSWECQIMNLKLAEDGQAFVGDTIKAIQYAKVTLEKQGKRGVFNASFAGAGRSQAMLDTLNSAKMLFAASTGNFGITDPTGVFYPAAYNAETPYVLSVTASTYDDDDRLMNGVSWVGADIAAPGSWIATTSLGGGYTHAGATSMAAPHVATALAIMQDIEPDL